MKEKEMQPTSEEEILFSGLKLLHSTLIIPKCTKLNITYCNIFPNIK